MSDDMDCKCSVCQNSLGTAAAIYATRIEQQAYHSDEDAAESFKGEITVAYPSEGEGYREIEDVTIPPTVPVRLGLNGPIVGEAKAQKNEDGSISAEIIITEEMKKDFMGKQLFSFAPKEHESSWW